MSENAESKTGPAVLIVTAVRQELQAGITLSNGRAEFLFTGIGKANASRKVGQYLAAHPVRLVVSAGFAGGTRPGYRVGDLIMASEIHDMSTGRTYKPHWCPTRMDGKVLTGLVLTANVLVPDPAAKAELGKRFGAACVEMEAAAVAKAASDRGIPWIAIRTILDPMEAHLRVGSFVQALSLSMTSAGRRELAGFFHSIRYARNSLADGIRLLVPRV